MLGPVGDVVFSGVDLDDCIDPNTGHPNVGASFLISSLGSYTELSPSGKGTKTFLIGQLGEGRGPHIVVDLLAPPADPAGPVRHQSLSLGLAYRATEIRLAR